MASMKIGDNNLNAVSIYIHIISRTGFAISCLVGICCFSSCDKTVETDNKTTTHRSAQEIADERASAWAFIQSYVKGQFENVVKCSFPKDGIKGIQYINDNNRYRISSHVEVERADGKTENIPFVSIVKIKDGEWVAESCSIGERKPSEKLTSESTSTVIGRWHFPKNSSIQSIRINKSVGGFFVTYEFYNGSELSKFATEKTVNGSKVYEWKSESGDHVMLSENGRYMYLRDNMGRIDTGINNSWIDTPIEPPAKFEIESEAIEQVVQLMKSSGALDAAVEIEDDGKSVRLSIWVTAKTSEEEAKKMCNEFLKYVAALSNDGNPGEAGSKSFFRYHVSALKADESRLAQGELSDGSWQISW